MNIIQWLRSPCNYNGAKNKENDRVIAEQIESIKRIIEDEDRKIDEKDDADVKDRLAKDKICRNCGSAKVVDRMISKSVSVTDGFSPFLGIRDSHTESYN